MATVPKPNLKTAADLFSTENERQGAESQLDRVISVPVEQLFGFRDHPFRVLDDDKMAETVESVRTVGVLVPLTLRLRKAGGYEIIAGHRRKRAAELAGLTEVPAIVRDLDDDAAIIAMVDSNLQREELLPSEKAKAYKMKLDAMRRQAGRPSKENSVHLGQNFDGKNSPQVAANFRSDDEVAKDAGISGDTVRRYIRLTELVPEALDMVDSGKIPFVVGVEMSHLDKGMQFEVLDAIDSEGVRPSLAQMQKIKRFYMQGNLGRGVIDSILQEAAQDADVAKYKVELKGNEVVRYFPKGTTPAAMKQQIVKLLEGWARAREKNAAENER